MVHWDCMPIFPALTGYNDAWEGVLDLWRAVTVPSPMGMAQGLVIMYNQREDEP